MTRSIVSGLLGLLSVIAIGSIPSACQSGGVGDPCVPEDEYDSQFAGFKVSEENIESRSFQCETRICLVNHFQGRVSCPLGQQTPVACPDGANAGDACDGGSCKRSQILQRNCTENVECAGAGNVCDGGVCRCEAEGNCPTGFRCLCEDANDENCTRRSCAALVCASEGCQVPLAEGAAPGDLAGLNCCIPGTDTPIATPVCAQCATATKRDADSTVYCSCRCGVAEGAEEDRTSTSASARTGSPARRSARASASATSRSPASTASRTTPSSSARASATRWSRTARSRPPPTARALRSSRAIADPCPSAPGVDRREAS